LRSVFLIGRTLLGLHAILLVGCGQLPGGPQLGPPTTRPLRTQASDAQASDNGNTSQTVVVKGTSLTSGTIEQTSTGNGDASASAKHGAARAEADDSGNTEQVAMVDVGGDIGVLSIRQTSAYNGNADADGSEGSQARTRHSGNTRQVALVSSRYADDLEVHQTSAHNGNATAGPGNGGGSPSQETSQRVYLTQVSEGQGHSSLSGSVTQVTK
jgi:hypothetical protein